MKPYFETDNGKLFNGDALKVLSGMESESVQCCITSPPYWGLRDYGVDGQLGLEKTPEEYVSKMVEIFRQVRRVLRKDGALWLNLGDSYANNGQGSWGNSNKSTLTTGSKKGAWAPGKTIGKTPSKISGLKPKDLCGIPWRVAFALQADGWYLRQDIIWHKPNPMPESVTDRCTKSHEYIFLMSKSAKYYYDNEAIKEKATKAPDINKSAYKYESNDPKYATKQGIIEARCKDYRKTGRNKRSVWTITTKPYKEAHFATFPPALILPCVLAGAAKGKVILDPFMGAGTVASVCEKHNRKWQGIELSSEYCNLIKTRIGNETRQLKLFV